MTASMSQNDFNYVQNVTDEKKSLHFKLYYILTTTLSGFTKTDLKTKVLAKITYHKWKHGDTMV